MKMLGAKAFWVVFRIFFIRSKEFLQKNQIKGWSSEGQTKSENLKSRKWKIREQWAKMSFVSRSLHAPLKHARMLPKTHTVNPEFFVCTEFFVHYRPPTFCTHEVFVRPLTAAESLTCSEVLVCIIFSYRSRRVRNKRKLNAHEIL